MRVTPDPTDNPTYAVKVQLPRRLHDAMKELAKRKRITVSLCYEWALELYLSQIDDMRYDSAIVTTVNLNISRPEHDKARDATTLSSVYEVAAYLYLQEPENYLGVGYELLQTRNARAKHPKALKEDLRKRVIKHKHDERSKKKRS